MLLLRNYQSHEETMRILNRKYKIAQMKCKERKIKREIRRLSFPFRFTIQFNKFIVLLSIATIVSYTVAAVFLQKYTMTELSPTLTTCVYAFFGTDLIGLSGIKICDTRSAGQETDIHENNIPFSLSEDEETLP